MTVFIGTSGWQYKSWRGRFYPQDLRQASWLEYFAERFRTVEVNNAFYRLPEASTFEAWARRTPDDFVVGVKASRYLTHIKRLNDPAEPVSRFLERATHLGTKLGPVLLQLPPSMKCDLDRLRATLGQFPRDVRVTVEFRHPSWFVDETRHVLEERQVALCLADSPHRATPVWRTAEWGYLRLHEGCAEPRPCYDGPTLDRWAEQLAARWGATDDIFVYFNNDTLGCAVRDAAVFASTVEKAGMRPTRVPQLGEVAVG